MNESGDLENRKHAVGFSRSFSELPITTILPLSKNLRIRNPGKQESAMASDTDALQFLKRVAEVIKNVAWQQ